MKTTKKTIQGIEVEAKVGSIIKIDDWKLTTRLGEGDDYIDESYRGCQFRIPSNSVVQPDIPINIEITGRTFQNFDRVRIKVEFVHDGEPSDYTHGWLYTHDGLYC